MINLITFSKLISLFIISYLVGSIPFSYLVAKKFGKIDLRHVGSGNPGGSNVLDNMGILWGIFAGLLDVSKGLILVMIAIYLNLTFLHISAIVCGAIVGHCWSLYLGGKGGRGISTVVGTLLPLYPVQILSCFSLVFIFFILKRRRLNRIGPLILDSALGTFIALWILLLLFYLQNDQKALNLMMVVFSIIMVRRITDNPKEYFSRNFLKILFLRLVYDRNVYDNSLLKKMTSSTD